MTQLEISSGLNSNYAHRRFGRRFIVLASLVVYEAWTIACIWAPNVVGLILLRAAEGLSVAACIAVTQVGNIDDAF